ncbi:MAG TPA: permease-like cell division protein FtsX [Chitinophagaceae bacterium]|nr:permease-like cell division protein FtsX [Chitinophagaceae bacterium]
MRSFTVPLLLYLLLSSCQQKNMTLKELQNAKWGKLSEGIDHISTKKQTGPVSDSLEFLLKGYLKDGVLTEAFQEESDLLTSIMAEAAGEHLKHSAAGYLRFNSSALMKPATLYSLLYLNGDYTAPFSFSKDSTILVAIPGIVSASFTSKEEAKKKFIGDGNDDWSRVLADNPLPNLIEIKLEDKKWTRQSVKELEATIREKITMAFEFHYSDNLFEETNTCYYFEYKRK